MRFAALLVVGTLAACAAPPPYEAQQPPRELAGRTAGPAQKCVLIQRSEGLRTSNNNGHTLLYGSGKTIWANDLGPGCGFAYNDLLISEPSGSYYCRGDIIRSMDRYSKIRGPSCVLGDFVPYRR